MTKRPAVQGADPPGSTPHYSNETAEADAHSFIVKVWIEEFNQSANKNTWRGHITHVLSGQRQHLQKLDDVIKFIMPFLVQMGVDSAGLPMESSENSKPFISLRSLIQRIYRRFMKDETLRQTKHE